MRIDETRERENGLLPHLLARSFMATAQIEGRSATVARAETADAVPRICFKLLVLRARAAPVIAPAIEEFSCRVTRRGGFSNGSHLFTLNRTPNARQLTQVADRRL